MVHEIIIKNQFRNYLMNKCGVSYSTASAYISALNKMSKMLKHSGYVRNSICEIRNMHELLEAKVFAKSCEDYNKVNRAEHGNCAVSLRHYYDFAAGNDNFSHVSNKYIRVR